MRLAFCSVLLLATAVTAQDKKPEKITPENIEVGKVGTIDRLTVARILDSTKYPIVASFRTVTVLVTEYSSNGLGIGKVLPAGQLWLVKDVTDQEIAGVPRGTYIITPAKKK